MWHRRRRRRLGVKTKHRKALLRNLVRGLALHRQIETTLARARETARVADKMVTLAKEGTLSARRQLIRHLGSSEVAKLFMDEIAPRLQDRNGGYTRVLKMGNRNGDGALRALVEFSVPIEIAEKEAKSKKEKRPKEEKRKEQKPEKLRPQKTPAVKKEEKKEEKAEKEKSLEKPEKEKKTDKEETQKRGGFLSKLRKFLKGSEE